MLHKICCIGDESRISDDAPYQSWKPTLIVYDGELYNRDHLVRCCETGEKRGPVETMGDAYRFILANDLTSITPMPVPSDQILAYIHDDVTIYEQDWDQRVLAEFEDPTVGVVGFGGATGLGTPDIYKTPYRLQQLIRINYASNVTDAETHGCRFAGVRDVAVLDGFSLIVRREVLDKAGGWPTDKLVFHMYDAWICLMARRLGYRVRLVGIDCFHAGGQTSTRPAYNDWLQSRYGKSDVDVHREAHEYIYEEFRDVLPVDVRGKR